MYNSHIHVEKFGNPFFLETYQAFSIYSLTRPHTWRK